ncbi:hypothetical protein JCM16106_17390 [Hydrogenophilus islandicus]
MKQTIGRHAWHLGISLLVLLVVGGCATPRPDIPGGVTTHKGDLRESSALFVGRDYLLSPGDELEIVYQFDTQLQPEYRLAIGDQIRVEFVDYPQLDRTVDVRPDGRITVPYLGDVSAAGKTPMELARELDERYSKLLTKPRSTVSLVRYGQRIRDLKEAIRTATRGQSRLTVVGPDGRITLPLIEPIFVAGKTIDEAQRAIIAAYAQVIDGLNVSTLLLKATGNRAYVFGYVGRPNFVELIGPTTVTQAIAMAGGLDARAEAETVLLITRDEANHPVGRVINLKEILTTGNLGKDPILRQGDVVYVPNTRLADAALTAEQLWALIPRFFSFSYQRNL